MVTFAVSPVEANKVELNEWERPTGHPVAERREYKDANCRDVLQASPNLDARIGSPNGFVHGVVRAYNNHHHLVLRPDDVWLAIMTQFGLFVNKNAEDLRHALVKHQEGQKELVVKDVGSLRTVDYGYMATQMIDQMTDHLVDP
ncbi:hypothetical protein DYB32_007955, partial [Aphanomyces invadans]